MGRIAVFKAIAHARVRNNCECVQGLIRTQMGLEIGLVGAIGSDATKKTSPVVRSALAVVARLALCNCAKTSGSTVVELSSCCGTDSFTRIAFFCCWASVREQSATGSFLSREGVENPFVFVN